MARPQKVSDNDILRAAYDLILEHGPAALTFTRLGRAVGLVPAALAKRFTKRQLIAAVDRYALKRSNAALNAVFRQSGSPIDAIIAGLTAEMSFARSMRGFINAQAWFLADLADNELYDNYHVSFHQRQRQIAELLGQAQSKDELSKDVDCEQMAQLLQMVQQGAGHVWAMTQKDPIDSYIDRAVRQILKPYIPAVK